jgi:hypothetical protein
MCAAICMTVIKISSKSDLSFLHWVHKFDGWFVIFLKLYKLILTLFTTRRFTYSDLRLVAKTAFSDLRLVAKNF